MSEFWLSELGILEESSQDYPAVHRLKLELASCSRKSRFSRLFLVNAHIGHACNRLFFDLICMERLMSKLGKVFEVASHHSGCCWSVHSEMIKYWLGLNLQCWINEHLNVGPNRMK
jgi:hypothetical protein